MKGGNHKPMGAHTWTRKRASGEREAEVLAVLHRAEGPLVPGEVAALLDGEVAYSTVVTILTRLYTKQQLTRAPRGRAYAYAPVTDRDGFAARRIRRVLDAQPDREAVLARFVSELSLADEHLLRRLLGLDAGHRR